MHVQSPHANLNMESKSCVSRGGAAMLAVLIILLLEVTTGQGVLTHWLQL